MSGRVHLPAFKLYTFWGQFSRTIQPVPSNTLLHRNLLNTNPVTFFSDAYSYYHRPPGKVPDVVITFCSAKPPLQIQLDVVFITSLQYCCYLFFLTRAACHPMGGRGWGGCIQQWTRHGTTPQRQQKLWEANSFRGA